MQILQMKRDEMLERRNDTKSAELLQAVQGLTAAITGFVTHLAPVLSSTAVILLTTAAAEGSTVPAVIDDSKQ